MADTLLTIKKSTLDNIGDSIREKTGKSALISPDDMPDEIASIQTGGGEIDPANLPQVLQDAGINATLRYGTGGSYDIIITGDELQHREFYINGTSQIVKSITFLGEPSDINDYWLYNQDALTEITIPESVRRIGSNCFANCDNLSKVKILPKTITIADNAFSVCPLLLTIGVGSQYDIELPEDIKVFPNFRQADRVEEVVVPNGVTQIVQMAYCYNLRSITIPDSVKMCGSFQGDKSLEDFSAAGVTGTLSLEGCTALKNVYLPKVTSLGLSGFFRGDTALQTVQIGSIGFPVTVSRNDCFTNVTQTTLTITVYCSTAYSPDTLLANIRNGAKNCTIVLKAANNIVYNGTEYQAGDVVITSTP